MSVKIKANYSALTVVFILGTVLSFVVFVTVRRGELDRFSLEFKRQAKDRTMAVSNGLNLYRNELESFRSFFEHSEEVTEQEFALYTEPMMKHRGVKTLEWIPCVRSNERAAFEARTGIQIREQGPGAALVPAKERAEYFPIERAVPFELNEAALGFDLASNPERWSAMETARDLGRATAMELVRLVEDPAAPQVFMMVSPVFEGSPEGRGERRENLKGFVLGMYRLDRIVESAMERISPQGLAFLMEDVNAAPGNQLLYRHEPRVGPFDWDCTQTALLSFETIVDGLGRSWRITVLPSETYIQTHLSRAYWWILPLGLLFTLLIAQLLRMQQLGQLQAERLVRERTADLRDSESRFREILESSNDWIWEVNTEGVCTYASPQVEAVLGYKPEEMLGTTPFDLMPPEEAERVAGDLKNILKTARPIVRLEHICLHKAGHRIFVETNGVPVFGTDGTVEGYRGVNRDITERKQAELELEKSRRFLRTIIDATPMKIFWKDKDSNFLGCNLPFAQSQGFVSPAELIGRNDSNLLPNKEEVKVYRADELEVMESGLPKLNYKESQTRVSGKKTILRTSKVPLRNRKDEVVGILGICEDITEQEKMADELRATRNRLRLATQAAEVGIWEYDIPESQLIWDERMFELYDADPAGFIGNLKSWLNVLHPEDFPKMEQKFHESVKKGVPFNAEFRVIWPDGSIRHLRAQSTIEHDAEGRPIRVVGVNWDVTSYRNMIGALKESEAKFRDLVESSSDWIWEVNTKGLFTYVSPKIEAMLGYTPEEVLGKVPFDLMPAEETERITDLFWGLMAAGSPVVHLENVNLHKDGHCIIVEINGVPFFDSDGRVAGYRGMNRDITARKEAENARLRVQKQLEYIVNNTKDVIFQMDLQGNYIYTNAAAEALTGYEVDQILTMNMRELVAPEYHELAVERLKRRISGNADGDSFSFEIICKDGCRVWVELITTEVYDAQGKLEALQSIARNITEQKKASDELRAARNRLNLATQAAEVGIWEYDIQNDQQVWDERMFSLYGIDPSSFTGNLESWKRALLPDEQPRAEQKFQEAIEKGISYNDEFRVIWPDGSIHHLRAQAIVEHDDEGRPVHVVGVNWDVTSNRHMLAALKESEARFRGLVESSLDWIWEVDEEMVFSYASPQVEVILGYKPEEIIGKSPFDFMPPKEAEQMVNFLEERILKINSPVIRMEHIFLHKDGRRLFIETNGVPFFDTDGNVLGYRGIDRDITERKHTEDALAKEQRLFAEAERFAHIGNWEFDLVENKLFWSDEIYRIFDINPQTTAPDYQLFLEAIHPEDRAFVDKAYQDSLAERIPYSVEHRLLLKDGTIKHVQERCRTDYDEYGNPLRSVGTVQDITGRKKAEEELRAAKDRLQYTMDNMQDVIFSADVEGNGTYVNTAIEAMLGYRPEDLIGSSFLQLVAPEYVSDMIENMRRATEGEMDSARYEHELIHKDGTRRWCETVSHVQRDVDSGAAIAFQGIIRDITERKLAEQERARALAFLQMVIDEFPGGLMVINLDYTIALANKNVCQVEDERTPDSALSTCHYVSHGFGVPCDGKNHLCPMKKVLETRAVVVVEHMHFDADGREFPVEIIASPIFDKSGEIVQIIETSYDITERKKLEEGHLRLSAAIDQVEESVVITDVEGTIQYVNPAFEKISGYSADEVVGQNPRILKSGEQNAAFYRAMWDQLKSGDTWAGRLVNRKKDGTLCTVEATISPVKDAEGKVANYVSVRSDVTFALIREEQLRQVQKMESVGRLASGIAHDFNNILQTISGFSGLLLVEMDAQSALRKDVLEIQSAVEIAGALTRQLLTFSRKQPTEYKRVDLNEVLCGAQKMFRQAVNESIHLEFLPGAELEFVCADETQLVQVAMNLVVNARDAMPEGGAITLRTQIIEIREEDLCVNPAARIGMWVCFSVSDTGCGMNEVQLARLFEPFYSTKQLGKGTGLGLSVVYGIVKEHQGWITVDSEQGTGTEFKVYLPLIENADLAANSGEGAWEALSNKQILLVDDDPVVLELTMEILQNVGYVVFYAGNVQEAKEVFSQKNGAFDLLFIDVMLPDGNGIDLADALLEQKPGLPVLLFSGYDEESANADRITSQGYAFMPKPFNLQRLLDKVGEAIEGS